MERLFPSIDSPDELRAYSLPALEALAAACREKIIETVSKNGGHLASNLGVVELTLALAHVFDFSLGKDRLIFDVGHQAYTWKMISGRADNFHSLRQKDGLSGFPKQSESPFDYYDAGHSSTAISIALGYQLADCIDGIERSTIALVGDGALTGGMSFEALNHAGQGQIPLKIIVNDNQMSIDGNVGGLSKHLDRLRVSRKYRVFKKDFKNTLGKWPRVGEIIKKIFSRAKSRIRQSLHKESIFFENLGFRYYGPVDGHDLEELIRYLEAIKDYDKPVVLHVVTKKGYGYKPAEKSPDLYHGVAPFEIETGLPDAKSESELPEERISFTDYVSDLLLELGKRDDVFAITAAMAQGTGLSAFAKAYPERFIDTGIAEQHAASLAAGLALAGKRVFLALYSTFSQRAVDQILHDICLENLPVCILLDRAGLVPADGETHQGLYDLSIFKDFPNLRIYAPADKEDVKNLLSYAMEARHPMIIRYPKDLICHQLPLDNHRIDGLRLLKSGEKYTGIVLGALALESLKAWDMLATRGLNGQLYSSICGNFMQFDDILVSLRKTKRLVLISESIKNLSLTEPLIRLINQHTEGCKILLCCVKDPLRGQASRSELLAAEKLDAEGLYVQIKDWLEE